MEEGVTIASTSYSEEARRRGRGLLICVLAGLVLWAAIYPWLHKAAHFLAADALGLSLDTRLGRSVAFFFFKAPQVLMLLLLIVFGVGIVRSFFTPERARRILAGRREFVGNVLASCLGIVTPFCSCSAVPLFIGFVETGIPLGVTLSFLISAPLINEVAVVLLLGTFGCRVAGLYVATGLIIATLAGVLVGRLRPERFVEHWVYQIRMAENTCGNAHMTWEARVTYGLRAVREIMGRVWPYVVVGIAAGAGIRGYVPQGLMASFMGKDVWWGVPAAVLIGVPMYSNAAGIIPVMEALLEKGAALGTSLAFMMTVIGLSLPEVIILRRVLKWPLIGMFISVVAAGIIVVGYLFNAVM